MCVCVCGWVGYGKTGSVGDVKGQGRGSSHWRVVCSVCRITGRSELVAHAGVAEGKYLPSQRSVLRGTAQGERNVRLKSAISRPAIISLKIKLPLSRKNKTKLFYLLFIRKKNIYLRKSGKKNNCFRVWVSGVCIFILVKKKREGKKKRIGVFSIRECQDILPGSGIVRGGIFIPRPGKTTGGAKTPSYTFGRVPILDCH